MLLRKKYKLWLFTRNTFKILIVDQLNHPKNVQHSCPCDHFSVSRQSVHKQNESGWNVWKKKKGKRQSTSLRWWKEYNGEGLALLSECPWRQCAWNRTLDLVTHDLSHTTTWAGGDKDESGDVDRFPPSKGEGKLVSSNDPGVSLLPLRLGLKTLCYGLESQSQINATGKSKARQRLHGTCLAESPTKDHYERVAPSEPDGLSSFIRAEKGTVPFIFPTTGRKNTHTLTRWSTVMSSYIQKFAHSLLGQNHTIFIKFPNLPQNFQHIFSWKNVDVFFQEALSLCFLNYLNLSQQNSLSLWGYGI